MTASAPALSKRIAALALLLLLAVSGFAGAAAGRSKPLRFAFVPGRALAGSYAAVGVSVRRSGVRCELTVRYADGTRQRDLPPAYAVAGRAAWRWRIPTDAAAGTARVTASCARLGSVSRRMVVVGSVIPARVEVEKKGYSIRPSPYGGTSVSYGIVLRNESPHQDALDVNVLVNFVDSANRLFGTETSNVGTISAGSTYALGSDLGFPAAAPVARLEVVVQVGGRAPHAPHAPAVANLRVLPDLYDRGFVGSVEGELINDDPGLVLSSAQLSTVVFDAAGNVLGGGSGYAFASLPPGAREFFKITTGLGAIPIERAASAQVSVEPSYRQGG